MAVLAAYDFVDLCPWKSVQVYTIGAPRPGNKAFADKYEAKVPDTWHVMNSRVMLLNLNFGNSELSRHAKCCQV